MPGPQSSGTRGPISREWRRDVLNGGNCERKRQLLEDVLRALSELSDASENQDETLGQRAAADPSELENTLHRAISAQEQALTALKRHQQEHGC